MGDMFRLHFEDKDVFVISPEAYKRLGYDYRKDLWWEFASHFGVHLIVSQEFVDKLNNDSLNGKKIEEKESWCISRRNNKRFTEGRVKSDRLLMYNLASLHVSNCEKGYSVPQIIMDKKCEIYNSNGQDCTKCSHYNPDIEVKHDPLKEL